MKQILLLITCFYLSLTVFCQTKNNAHLPDSTVIDGANYGVVSKKALDGKYAILYIYRPKSRKHSFASFTINVHDTPVCKIKSNNSYTIKLYKFGQTEIWAKSESKSSVGFNIEKGKAYYLKCNVKKGFWGEIPDLVLMNPKQGKEEFDEAEEGDYE